jgi:hypothetical protein
MTLTRVDSLLHLVTDTNTTIGAILVKDDLYRRTMTTVAAFDHAAVRSGKTLDRLDKLGSVAEFEVPRILAETDTMATGLRRTSVTAESLGIAGLRLVRTTQILADSAQKVAERGDVLVGKGNRLMTGIEHSWLLGRFMAPADTAGKAGPR